MPLLFHQRTHVSFAFKPSQSIKRTTRDLSFFKAVVISFASM